ncbi:MAG: class I SAM-dependent methyltransferase [Chloroflexi bacterium]|nr:class I SAM-dependent methyltransferase [Chloroflexota bacterium]
MTQADPEASGSAKDRRAYFEELYREQQEPWTYGSRAAEVLRHDFLARTVRRLRPHSHRILDVGCSVGQLTARLAGASDEVHAMDLSPVAVRRARARCLTWNPDAGSGGVRTDFRFYVGSGMSLPFRPETFDLVLMCDGFESWRLTPEEQTRTLQHVHPLLVPGGLLILSDHLKPRQFDPFLGRVRESPFEVVSVRYLHNRLWYSFERGLRPVKELAPTRALLASLGVARALGALASLAGRHGAKHLCVVSRKKDGGRDER